MRLDKLADAPWIVNGGTACTADGIPVLLAELKGRTDEVAFAALARNAFDVMVRRGWGVSSTSKGLWFVPTNHMGVSVDVATKLKYRHDWPCPFTALIEAERWYKENIEKPNTTP